MLNNEHCAFSAGNQLYDFVYITDAAQMFIEIGKHGIANRTYYIGSQKPRPLKEFDINAVKKDTGYIPEITFAQGIKNTLEWIKEMG